MRVVRRVAFAAPFVVIVACKKPVAEPRDPDDEDEEDEQAEIVRPRSATVEPPPNAYVEPVVAISDAALPDAHDWGIDRCTDRRVPARDKVGCNPPPPPVCGENGVTCNPPKPLRGRVISVQVQGAGSIVIVGRGSKDGIDVTWKGCLLKNVDSDACLSGGDLALLSVSPTASKFRSTATMDQIHVAPYVKLTPP